MERTSQFATNTDKYLSRQRASRRPISPKDLTAKHTLKYLAICKDPRAYCAVTRAAPDSTIQSICNAALNVEQGDIQLTPKEKALFRKHRVAIGTLTNPRVSLARKRKVIQSQKGGFFWLPALLGTALGSIGSSLIGNIFGKLFGGQQQQQQPQQQQQ